MSESEYRIFGLDRVESYVDLTDESVIEVNDVIPREYVVRDGDFGEDLEIFTTLDEAKEFVKERANPSPKKALLRILDESWDDFVKAFEERIGKNFWTTYYWTAYHFLKDGDVDGGTCGEIRKHAIEKLYAIASESSYSSRNPKKLSEKC